MSFIDNDNKNTLIFKGYVNSDILRQHKEWFYISKTQEPLNINIPKRSGIMPIPQYQDVLSVKLKNDVYEIFKGHLDEKQLKSLSNEMANARKKINKANFSECTEYFDKKRDLVLGGAPTDILTQIFGIGLCSWAVTRADKEDRWSKLFTNGVPIITGLLSSLVFSAKLYAGAKSLIAGAVVTGITDVVCGVINKHVFGNKDDDDLETDIKTVEAMQPAVEVQNA